MRTPVFRRFLKTIFLILCAVIWFVFVSQLNIDPRLVGDIKFWGGLLSVALGLSAWARFSLKCKAAQEAYDSLLKVGLFYMGLYVFYRLVFVFIFDALLAIPISSIVAFGFALPFLISTIMHTQVTPILVAHGRVAQAKRYIARMQTLFPQSIELAAQKIAITKQEDDDSAMLAEINRIIALYPRPKATDVVGDQLNQALMHIYEERLGFYLKSGEAEKALADARLMLSIQHSSDLAYIHRGMAFILVDDFDAAASDLEHGLKVTTLPRLKVIAEINLGLIDYVLGNDDAALEHWSRALEIELPSDETGLYATEVHVCIGLMAFHRGDSFKAWHAYRTALKLNPQSIAAHAGMAIIHAADDRWDLALKIWRRLLAEHPYFADPDDVIRRHFRWTPPMVEGVRQIAERVNGTLIDSSPTQSHAEDETPMSLAASR